MEYQYEKDKASAKFSFSVSAEEWEQHIQAAYVKNKNKFNVPGFRKGHVPRKTVEKMYGVGVFFDDAFNACASACYGKALDEHEDIVPVGEPKVDMKDFDEKGISFDIQVDVRPEVTLGQYKGLTVEKSEYTVSSEDIDAELNRAREAKSRTVEVTDRAVKDGDTLKLDYAGSIEGVPFNGGTAQDQQLTVGSNTFIPGFEPQLVGMNIGQTKDISVKFPEDYHAEVLKGKDAVFTVTIHGITEKQLPELDDQFAKDTTQFDSLAEYKADIETRLKKNADDRADRENKNRMIDEIVSKCEAEIPSSMVESELDYMLQDFEQRLGYTYGGMKLDDYFKYTNSSREDFRKDRADDAKKSVMTRLVVESIIKAEDITATEEETDNRLQEIAKQGGKEVAEYKKSVHPYQLNQIRNDIVLEKLLNQLASETKFELKKSETTKKAATKSVSTAKAKKETADKE